jgi:hypothetical protein
MKTFAMSLPAGDVQADLSFKRCDSLDLILLDAANVMIGERLGPSVVTLDSAVTVGNYSFAVSGGKCNFTLTVTAPG